MSPRELLAEILFVACLAAVAGTAVALMVGIAVEGLSR